MIKWRLSEIIAKRGISGKDLADKIKVHPNTVSRLRNSPEMPSIDGDLLDKLCNALNCFPVDLIEYIPLGQKIEENPKIEVKNTLDRFQKITSEIIRIINPIVEIPSDQLINVIDKIFQILIDNMY